MQLRPLRCVWAAYLVGIGAVPPAWSQTAATRLSTITADQPPDWTAVDRALGRRGQPQDGGIYRIGMPRTDLQVTVHGIPIRPALSLGSWIAFKPRAGDPVVMMADLVVTEAELNPVLGRLQQGGVGQFAVHKHLPDHTPALWWIHLHADGDPVAIAATLREALALTGTPTSPPAPPGPADVPFGIDTAAVRQALGRGGRVVGGVYQVNAGRAETIRAMGIEVPPLMGVGTVMNFQPTENGRAVINGDFAMIGSEVDSVLRALRSHGIDVVEVHHHVIGEEPRLYFVHFWAHDDAVTLARGLRAALDQTKVR